jgi:PAP2 superfamily
MSDLALNAVSRPRRVLSVLLESFRAQWIFFVIPALYLISNWMMLSRLESYQQAPVYGLLVALLSFTVPVGIIVMLLLRLAQYIFVIKPDSAIRALASDVGGLIARPRLILNALPVFAAMVLFNKAMVELKPAIPALNPFSWDVTFMAWDRVLHFGSDPWVVLQGFMGFDAVTFAVNMAYNFWFVALFGAWFWFGFQRDANELRTRFFLAYMLSWWVGGGLMAVAFSSAGPVYYGALGLSPDPFAAQMAYLHDVDSRLPIWALDTQKLLWNGYTGKTAALGISAFPSMHNAAAVLFALAFWKVSRKAGWFFVLYAVVIFLASVHLAWHYAIDGYAGAVIAVLSWWAAGPVARWFSGLSSTRRYNQGLASL